MQGRRPLQTEDHKYSRGVVAVIAGSKKYPGAAILTVGGARRGGAGYVKFLNKHQSITDLVISQFPDVVPFSTIVGEKIDALVVGPGATTLRKLPSRVSIVLDSGAFDLARQRAKGVAEPNQIVVVTPHEGELASLGFSLPKTSIKSKDRDKVRIEVAEKIAEKLQVICVLKGHRTVIAAPNSRSILNVNSGPELATAGSGDILAGVIASFIASHKPQSIAAAQEIVSRAVHLHSAAGKHAARTRKSVVATDILESLSYC